MTNRSSSSSLASPDFKAPEPLPLNSQLPEIGIWNVEAIALLMYFYRDAFAGALRYYLSLTKLDVLWFLPDIFALMCILAFIQRYIIKGKSLIAVLTLLYIAFALYVGFVFLGYFAGMASSFKMIAPVFVGFCFCRRDFNQYKQLLALIHPIFFITIIGIFLSSRVQFPWVGFAYETLGATRQATRLWWAASEARLAGFAADSTMAAFFVFITFVFTSARKSMLWICIWAPVGLYAIKLTTSKTTLGVMIMYLLCLVIIRMLPERERFPMLRRMAMLSFASILVPVVLMVFFAGDGLTSISRGFFSLQDRINNSWQLPFVYMQELMPVGFVTGCGLGCFNYPQQLFSNKLSYYVPVDNFYIGTYLMFGPIFVLFMVFAIAAVSKTKDIYKLSGTIAMNLFTITVLAYGPASGLIMIGAAFSQMFAKRRALDQDLAISAPIAPGIDGLASRPA
ncbi:hypothetical protein [Bradyrhizobium sp. JYMT SZCCT0180]|uniref:hypothetical protein n=1 Tax=Bradyrhizobium sp. JYMT SZCCT0180 TaxID=2807666 RepID=UPI001BA9350A|nr:hypothetical protein [Bradyrhizobium sp. JYMT SZCCT0180]MBR1209251.1 hypothetical protein [Bradyrhizobium sp. JYMT SZCCT0180]